MRDRRRAHASRHGFERTVAHLLAARALGRGRRGLLLLHLALLLVNMLLELLLLLGVRLLALLLVVRRLQRLCRINFLIGISKFGGSRKN